MIQFASKGMRSISSILLVAAAFSVMSPTTLAQSQLGAEARLKEKNITVPAAPKPVANYTGYTRVGNLLFLSGAGPSRQSKLMGKVGKDLTADQGYQAARETGLNLLGVAREALGSLDKVKHVVKVFGMVNSAPGFGEQPKVINGCSDLLVEVFGETIGKGARSSAGVAELPFGIPVEIDMILEVSD